MSYAGQPAGFGLNGKSIYSNVAKLMSVNMQFTVTPTNGLGVTSLKSNGYVNNVFMHTSTTPAANGGFTNPNPANGYAWIQLKNNFNYFLGGVSGFVSKNSGNDVKVDNSAMTVGQAYVITTLGDLTAAQWRTLGVPVGVTPAVGVSFIALLVGVAGEGNTSTSKVQVPSVSGICGVEIVGTTNTMVNSSVGSNAGQWVMVQFLAPSFVAGAYTPAGTISKPSFTVKTGTILANGTMGLDADASSANVVGGTGITADRTLTTTSPVAAPTFSGSAASLTGTVSYAAAAPATGSIVTMQLWFDGSSVTVDGL